MSNTTGEDGTMPLASMKTEDGRKRIAAFIFENFDGLRVSTDDPMFVMLGVVEQLVAQQAKHWTAVAEGALEERVNEAVQGMQLITERFEKNLLPMLREVLEGIEAKGDRVKEKIERELIGDISGKVAVAIAAEVRRLMDSGSRT